MRIEEMVAATKLVERRAELSRLYQDVTGATASIRFELTWDNTPIRGAVKAQALAVFQASIVNELRTVEAQLTQLGIELAPPPAEAAALPYYVDRG